jgi:ribonuclease/clavin/mitogillin
MLYIMVWYCYAIHIYTCSRILIDTGAGINGYLANLQDCMAKSSCQHLSAILCTHWHHDHTGGLKDILPVLKTKDGDQVPVYKHIPSLRGSAPPSLVYEPIQEAQEWIIDDCKLSVVFTPGHTADSLCFLLDKEHALFCGDTILGHGTTVFRSLYDYMRSLYTIQQLSPLKLYPGHGDVVTDPTRTISEYITHRQSREQQLIRILKEQPSKEFSGWDLLAKMYPTVVSDIKYAALQNAILHVEKLERDGVVNCVQSDREDQELRQKEKEARAANSYTWESSRDYGETSESTTDMVQRKSDWKWKWNTV